MKQKLPNIVFIVMDNVGAKHMSLYGYHRQTTPNLERLAEECMVYSRCFAAAYWTIPSHASMFTGLYPGQHGAYEGRPFLDENIQHLVSVLKMSGYLTLGISANGLVSPATGLCRDFDHFQDLGAPDLKQFLDIYQQEASGLKDELSARLESVISLKDKFRVFFRYIFETGQFKKAFARISPTSMVKSASFTEKIINLSRDLLHSHSSKKEQPFFLFINFMEAHAPFRPPLKFRKFSHWYDKESSFDIHLAMLNSRWLSKVINRHCNLYDDGVYYLDHMINELLMALKYLPTTNETVIIITSDHGEHFGEKRMYNHLFSLYNELVWVPLVVCFPKKMKMSGVDDRLVSLTDLYSTILDLTLSPMPTPRTSISLLSNSKRELTVSQNIYPEYFRSWLKVVKEFANLQDSDFSPHGMAIITAPGLKIIEKKDGGLEVYDLRRDMGESNNLVPNLSPKDLENIRATMDFLKQDTGYYQAVDEIRGVAQ